MRGIRRSRWEWERLVRFEFLDGAIDAERLIEFMERLVTDSPRKVFLILDNLRVHHARVVNR